MIKTFSSFLLFVLFSLMIQATSISGNITDKKTHEPLIGATIKIKEINKMTVSDINGHFIINGLKEGNYTLIVSYISYITKEISVRTGNDAIIEMIRDEKVLSSVTVTTQRRMNTDASMLNATHKSLVIESGISSQQISRTQDRNASEVVRRIPGISVIDDKFIIVRGLSQRYNDVWINNASVPSTETDNRAFSFDIIPASQLSNVIIVKSPAPEYPSDFTGGLIKITTRDIPLKTGFDLLLSTGINTKSSFKNYLQGNKSGTDWLGFDNGKRSIDNTNWNISSPKTYPDMKLNLSYCWKKDDKWALLSALNYNYNNRIILNMNNSRYGIYNSSQDHPDFLYKYNDNQYTTNVHLGGLVNLIYKPNNNDKYELKQLFNQIGKDQYTYRDGYQYISGKYVQRKYDYDYYSRTTYSAQLCGTYLREKQTFNWNIGFSYANRRQPDRRIINQQEDDAPSDIHYGEMKVEPTDIQREKNNLDEDILSFGANLDKKINIANLPASLKVGFFGEYRNRRYRNRAYYYLWDTAKYPELGYGDDIISTVLNGNMISSGAIYLYDETDNRDSYRGHNLLGAGYIGLNIPLNAWNIYVGTRYEKNRMSLINNITIHTHATKKINYDTDYFFPSINTTYNLSDKQLFRIAYGASVNRPEFREVSPSTYYDFDLFSMVRGNSSLKTAYIQNIDLRYECYPSTNETISFALFYKHFRNPIEWTYLDAGGTYTYTFENANSANNFGAEMEIKKDLSFIGLPYFTFLFNGSLINSKIRFSDGSLQHNRPMQGQSPYIINSGLFYTREKYGLNIGLLYNRVGKRIVGVGRVDTSSGASVNNDIPDAYEMPRDIVDFSASKKINKLIELKISVRDIFSQDMVFKQYPKFYDSKDVLQHRSQVTKRYNTGTNFFLSLSMSL
jgi:TonB-dependent receptor